MGRTKAIPADLRAYRQRTGKDREEFWAAFGVTRTAASRYERERDLPVPLEILMWLELNGRISAGDLEEALTSVVKTYLRRQARAR